MRPWDNLDWSSLESNCHREDIQHVIGAAIREGTIRVIPAPHGRIRIIPTAFGGIADACGAAGRPVPGLFTTPGGRPRLVHATHRASRRWSGATVWDPPS